jgi:hypothetical protein
MIRARYDDRASMPHSWSRRERKSESQQEFEMKKFVRQNANNATAADITIDFGAASAQIARVLDPEVYNLRIESARVVQKNRNTLVALELIEVESGTHIATQPIWVDGPNANAGRLAAENRYLIAQLLALAGKPTAGNVHALIPELAGLTFEAQLAVAVDSRTGRSFNAIATIFADGGA